MRSQICDKTDLKLISTTGSSLDACYYDSRDISGNENIFSLLSLKTISFSSPAKLNHDQVSLPAIGLTQEIILSGNVENQKRGIPLSIILTNLDGTNQSFGTSLSTSGSYRPIFTVNPDSLPGTYFLKLSYVGQNLGTLSFSVILEKIPDWIKNNVKRWTENKIPDEDFVKSIQYLVKKGIIVI